MKEAIEDLEWSGGAVKLSLRRDPQRLTLASSGNGDLEVLSHVTLLLFAALRRMRRRLLVHAHPRPSPLCSLSDFLTVGNEVGHML